MQLVTAFWATLALMYMSFAAGTGKYPMWPGKMKCVRVGTAESAITARLMLQIMSGRLTGH